MCAFFFNSPRERFHTKLCPLSLNKKEKKRRRENVVEKVNLSSVGYTFIYICEAWACVYERRCDETTRQNCVSEKSKWSTFLFRVYK